MLYLLHKVVGLIQIRTQASWLHVHAVHPSLPPASLHFFIHSCNMYGIFQEFTRWKIYECWRLWEEKESCIPGWEGDWRQRKWGEEERRTRRDLQHHMTPRSGVFHSVPIPRRVIVICATKRINFWGFLKIETSLLHPGRTRLSYLLAEPLC